MNLFEILLFMGFAVVIVLLVRIDRTLKRGILMETHYRKQQELEGTVRNNMPTLWANHEFHDKIGAWFALATGQPDKTRQEEWHWPAIANSLKTNGRITSDEIERISNLSRDFLLEAVQSHQLSEFEARYLLYWVWNLIFSDPTLVVHYDVDSFEIEIDNMRNRFLKNEIP